MKVLRCGRARFSKRMRQSHSAPGRRVCLKLGEKAMRGIGRHGGCVAVNEHEEMITRLEWELQERKALVSRQAALQGEADALRSAIAQQHATLESLPGLLAALLEAAQPAAGALQDRTNAVRAQNALAGTLPDPLYAIYSAVTAFARAHGMGRMATAMVGIAVTDSLLWARCAGDATVSVEIAGSALEGEAYERETRELLSSGGNAMDVDHEQPMVDRHADSDIRPLDRTALLRAHPMTVAVSFGMAPGCGGLPCESLADGGNGIVTAGPKSRITFSYLARLQPMGTRGDEGIGIMWVKAVDDMLYELFPGDSGACAPWPIREQLLDIVEAVPGAFKVLVCGAKNSGGRAIVRWMVSGQHKAEADEEKGNSYTARVGDVTLDLVWQRKAGRTASGSGCHIQPLPCSIWLPPKRRRRKISRGRMPYFWYMTSHQRERWTR